MKKQSARHGVGRAAGMAAAVACIAACASAAVVAPFEDDFSTNPLTNANYSSEAEPAVSLTYGANNQLVLAKGTGGAGNFSLVAEVSNLGGTNTAGFALSSLEIGTNHENNQMALYALIDGAHTNNVALAGYTANFRPGLALRIYKDNSEVVTTNWMGNTSGPYDLWFNGAYDEFGELALTFTATDGVVTQSVSHVDQTPATNQFFGVGGRVLAASGGREIRYRNVALALGQDSPGPDPDPFDITGIDVSVDGGDTIVRVDFDSTGHAYTLQFKAQLPLSEWSNVVSGASSPLFYTNNAPAGFFRVGAE